MYNYFPCYYRTPLSKIEITKGYGKGVVMMWRENITLNMPYDFDYLLFRLDMDDLNYVDFNNRSVAVPLRIEEEKHVANVQAAGSIEEPVFIIEGKDKESKRAILSKITDIFAWDQDLQEVQQFFANTKLASLFENYPATPLIREFDPFSNLMKTIIHQQLNMAFAQVLTKRFVKGFGEELDGVWFYPTPDQVAQIPYEGLQNMQFSRRKAEYVIDTAKKIVAEELDLSSLINKSNSEIIGELTEIRGIGPWTAQNWLMFSLGRKDLFPSTDIGIQKALQKEFNLDRKPPLEQVEEWNKEWAPYRSYAAMTLWRSIEEP